MYKIRRSTDNLKVQQQEDIDYTYKVWFYNKIISDDLANQLNYSIVQFVVFRFSVYIGNCEKKFFLFYLKV